jgi:hypothetical protein
VKRSGHRTPQTIPSTTNTKTARELSRAAFGMNCRISGSAHRCVNNKLGCGGFRVRLNCSTSVASCAAGPGAGRPDPLDSMIRTCPLRQLQETARRFRLYHPSRMPRFRFGSCDRCHRLLFEYPIIFWTLCAGFETWRTGNLTLALPYTVYSLTRGSQRRLSLSLSKKARVCSKKQQLTHVL